MESGSSIRPRLINAEPFLLLFSISSGLYITVYSVFVQFKTCIFMAEKSQLLNPFEENAYEFCTDLIGSAGTKSNISNDFRGEVEASASEFMIYYQIADNAPAVIAGFVVGAWSDVYGRKPPIIIALAGCIFSNFIMLSAAGFDSAPLYLLIIAVLVRSVTGHLIIHAGAFAMTSDSTSDPNKLTIRIGFLSGLIAAGHLIGSLSSAFVLSRWDNYSYIFAIIIASQAIAFLYTVFFAQETLHFAKPVVVRIQEETSQMENPEGTEGQVPDLETSPSNIMPELKEKRRGACLACFVFGKIGETIRVLFRQRSRRCRIYLLVALVSLLVAFSSDVGMPGILNMYVKLPPLLFTDSQYSYLVACDTFTMSLGLMVLPWIGKRLFHATDSAIIVIGLSLGVMKMLAMAFATQSWMIFAAISIGGLSAAYFTGFRAFMTKLVDRDETGRLFAAIMSTEHLGPLFSAFVFNTIFAHTLHRFAGCVYLVGGLAIGVTLLAMGWVHWDSRYHNDSRAQEVEESNQATVETDDQQRLVQ